MKNINVYVFHARQSSFKYVCRVEVHIFLHLIVESFTSNRMMNDRVRGRLESDLPVGDISVLNFIVFHGKFVNFLHVRLTYGMKNVSAKYNRYGQFFFPVLIVINSTWNM